MQLRDRMSGLAEGVWIAIDALRANKVRARISPGAVWSRPTPGLRSIRRTMRTIVSPAMMLSASSTNMYW